METLGCTLLSGNVIKKIVSGIINITAYQSNRTEELAKFEQGQPYLLNENMLLIGKGILLIIGRGIIDYKQGYYGYGRDIIITDMAGILLSKGSYIIDHKQGYY
jgi:hypothetical protein